MVTILFLSILTAAVQTPPARDLSRPAAITAGWISNRDYPRAALSAGEQGNVRIRYLVTERGRVSECTIEQSSGSAALDQQSCAIWMQRMRFRPARDASGRPIPEASTQLFAWRIGTPCGELGRRDICIVGSR